MKAKFLIGLLSFLVLCNSLFFADLRAETIFLDTSFGSSGFALINEGSDAYVTQVAMQTDGKILALGMCTLADVPTIFLARFTTTGSLDTTFNTTGIVTLNYGTNVYASSLAVQTDGKILIAGNTRDNGATKALIARYTTSGSPDSTFGSGGIVTLLIGTSTSALVVAEQIIDTTTYVLITGQSDNNNDSYMFIARYEDDGTPDTTFGSGGTVLVQHGLITTPMAMAVLSDAKILIGGSVVTGNRDMFLTRYTGNGTLDTDFGTEGITITSVPTSVDDSIRDFVIQGDGKIVAVGSTQIAGRVRILLARYSASGFLDNTFGNEGITTTVLGTDAFGSSISIKSNGTFVISGAVGEVGYLARYLANGSLDTDFGNDGFITTTLLSSLTSFPSCLDTSERMLIGGCLGEEGVVARYRAAATDYVSIASPVDASTITSDTFGISGHSSRSGLTVRVTIGSTEVASVATDSDGNWNAGTFSLPNNTTPPGYAIKADFINGGSVIATQTIHVYVNVSGAPDVVSIASPVHGSTVTTCMPTISGGSSEGGQSVEVKVDNVVITTVTTDSIGSWSAGNTCFMDDGTHTVDVKLLYGTQPTATSTFTVSSHVGPQGPQGPTGASGLTGVSGTTGLTGKTGVTGVSGVTGLSGLTGYSGLTGLTGHTGRTGNTGFSGFSGSTGLSGMTGISGLTGISGMTGMTGMTGRTGATGPTRLGNIVRVDAVYGNDSIGQRNGDPFATITAALAVAQSGDTVWIFPGTYGAGETFPFSVSSGVNIKGLQKADCIINASVTTATDLFTFYYGNAIENLTINLTGYTDVLVRGIVFSSTATANSYISNVDLNVTLSAGSSAASNAVGVYSNGSGAPGSNWVNLRQSNITVTYNGTGSGRGILLDTSANKFYVSDSNITATLASGAGTAYGVQTNTANAVCDIRASTIFGTTYSTQQSLGSIVLTATDISSTGLVGLGWTDGMTPKILLWSKTGLLSTGSNYLYPGIYGSTTTIRAATQVMISQAMTVKAISVHVSVAPSTNPVLFTVYKNSGTTLITMSLAAGAMSATATGNSVVFNAGDLISINVNKNGAGNCNDVIVAMEFY